MEMIYIVVILYFVAWGMLAIFERKPPLDDRRLLKAYCTYEHYKKTGKIRHYFEGC